MDTDNKFKEGLIKLVNAINTYAERYPDENKERPSDEDWTKAYNEAVALLESDKT